MGQLSKEDAKAALDLIKQAVAADITADEIRNFWFETGGPYLVDDRLAAAMKAKGVRVDLLQAEGALKIVSAPEYQAVLRMERGLN
jgi:hypothetical protein